MKHEWKKSEKDIYLPKSEASLLTIEKMKYFCLSGKGDPNNNHDFQNRIALLYSLSYGVKMMPKNGFIPKDYFEYAVYPLEGIWSGDPTDKESFNYTLMIRQPDFTDSELFDKVKQTVSKKKPFSLLDEATFEELTDGLCVQIMHNGSFDSEPLSFIKLDLFLTENSLQRRTATHKEIYLSDFNKTAPDKLKTVLRYFVE